MSILFLTSCISKKPLGVPLAILSFWILQKVIGQNEHVFTLQIENFQISWKILTQGFKPWRKVALFGSLGQWKWIWQFRSKFGPNLVQIWQELDLFWPFRITISKIYKKELTQGFKSCGEMVLFGSLGQRKGIWLFRSNFGTILAKIDLFCTSNIKISKFYENFLLRASSHVEKSPCLAL